MISQRAPIAKSIDEQPAKATVKPRKRSLGRVFLTSILITSLTSSLVIGVRFLGGLQMWELKAFDHLMRRRPHEKQDDRLLIVTATPEDIETQKQEPKNRASLSEDTLNRLFSKLKQYEPVAIGLDIFREFPVDADSYPNLATALDQDNLFGVCKVRDAQADPRGIKPPPELPPERISFVDAVTDNDGILRRHLLSMQKSEDVSDPCTATDNLSVMLALKYLQVVKPNVKPELTPQGEVKIGDVVLRELAPYTGSYQRVDAGGRQILLNYRSLPSVGEIATKVSVGDILNDQVRPERIEELKGRIILIGISDATNTSNDYWHTPYSIDPSNIKQAIPGVVVQAHMVSQLLSAVLDNRSFLWTLPEWAEIGWILGWAFLGSMFASKLKSPLHLVILIVLASSVLYGSCYLLILQSGWMPLIPAEMVLIISAGSMFFCGTFQDWLSS